MQDRNNHMSLYHWEWFYILRWLVGKKYCEIT